MESQDEWRRRMRHEQERRDDQRRQDQQRREDQRKRDETERRRRSDEKARLAEEARHNRAMEAGRARDNDAPLAEAPPRRSAAPAPYSGPAYAPRRRGGFTKLIVLIALIWGAIHFWPQIAALGRNALKSAPPQLSEPAADHTVVPPKGQAEVSGGPREAGPVRAAKPAARHYPRCSATITDECQSDH